MKNLSLLLVGISFFSFAAKAQPKAEINPIVNVERPAKVDYDAFEQLVKEVKQHRKDRLVNLDKFLEMNKEPGTIILDTRSDVMYNAKHIKGAIHLSFPDFTQKNLAKIIPSPDTRILIYCNNNIDNDVDFFPTKAVIPASAFNNKTNDNKNSELTLALNIPTYINLYGYGYKNVYELSEYVSVFNKRIEFEGSAVRK